MKIIRILIVLVVGINLSNAQNLRVSAEPNNTIQGESAFLDLSSFSTSPAGESRGLNFPQTDLTQFEFQSDGIAFGSFSTFYDGMIVYNTVAGTTPANTGSNLVGVGGQSVDVGFYYFSNPTSASVNGNGEWVQLGSAASKFTVSNTATETNTVTVAGPENVIELTGTTDGTNTKIDLGSTVDPTTINRIRKAFIYDDTGALLMIASGEFEDNSGNLVLITGDGMVNKLLPAATNYTVELYFVPN
jgi:hypothetical protein